MIKILRENNWGMENLYVDAIDELPPNSHKPRGRPIHINSLWSLIMLVIGLLDTIRLICSYISTEHPLFSILIVKNDVEISTSGL